MIFGAPAFVFARALLAGDSAIMPALCGLALLGCVLVKNNLDYFFWKQNLWLFFAHLGIYLGAIDHARYSTLLTSQISSEKTSVLARGM